MKKFFSYIIPYTLLFYSCEPLSQRTSGESAGINSFSESKGSSLAKSEIKTIEAVKPELYFQHVINPKNGLLVHKEIGNFIFSVQYKPCSFVAMTNLGKDSLSEENMAREVKEINGLQYFTFRIKIKDFHEEILKFNLDSEKEYENRVNYFAFRMQEDIKLVEGKDTLNCRIFHFERNYGVAPYANFILAFDNPYDTNYVYDKTISFYERVFGIGKVNITIQKENIANIPPLKYN